MIIGQEKICCKINSLTLDEFPRSLMLVGEKGSGKHLIVEYVAKRFNLIVRDITTTLDQETIEELYTRVEPYLYIIDANSLSIKDENAILKFIEEPLKNSYVVLLAETDIGLLQTVMNRCQIWYLQNYSKEVLKTFVNNGNEYVLNIAKTPGQVIELCNVPFDDMVQLADKIISKIDMASVANTLTLSNKIQFKEEKDKFDVKIFMNILAHRIVYNAISDPNPKYSKAYFLTMEFQKKLNVKNLDYKCLFERYLIQLRDIMRGAA